MLLGVRCHAGNAYKEEYVFSMHPEPCGPLQIDLMLCYNANASPVRNVQRSGRLGSVPVAHLVPLNPTTTLNPAMLQVDLVLCYDANASPVRNVQRSGRTGRSRAGRVVHLLAAGKEEQQFARQEAVRT